MRNLIKQIFEKWGCKHEWETVARTEYIHCYVYLFVCKKCGKMEKYNTSFNKKHLTKNQIERIYEILNEE